LWPFPLQLYLIHLGPVLLGAVACHFLVHGVISEWPPSQLQSPARSFTRRGIRLTRDLRVEPNRNPLLSSSSLSKAFSHCPTYQDDPVPQSVAGGRFSRGLLRVWFEFVPGLRCRFLKKFIFCPHWFACRPFEQTIFRPPFLSLGARIPGHLSLFLFFQKAV